MKYASLNNSHNNCHSNYTNRVFLQKLVFRSIHCWSIFASYGMHAMNYNLHLWGFLRVRDSVRRGNKITELGLFPMMEHDMGELFCCLARDYTIWICLHKHLALQEFHKFLLEFCPYHYWYYFIKCLNWINEFLAPSASIRLSSLDALACLSMSLSRLSGPWFQIPVGVR